MVHLILYSKPDCHLCEGLLEKLSQIHQFEFELEIRDINTQSDWFNAYQYEIPVLKQMINGQELLISRPSPRLSVNQLTTHLQKHLIVNPG